MADYSIKSIRQDFKDKGIFYTPKALGEYLKSFIDIEDYDEVYDPTCGHGNLLSIFNDNIKKYGQEINPVAFEVAKKIPNSDIKLGDTIAVDMFKDKQFKVILGNPPFSIKYEPTESINNDIRYTVAPCLAPPSKADYMFILHILAKLKDDGVAVILNFPGILYRKNKEGKIRQWLVENNYIDKVIGVPPNKFEDTTISTCILVLKKNRKTTDITFIEEIEKKGKDNEFLEKIATFEEIKENDFVLSPSNYIEKPNEVEKVDYKIISSDINNLTFEHIKNTLDISKFVITEVENKSILEHLKFVDDILKVIYEHINVIKSELSTNS